MICFIMYSIELSPENIPMIAIIIAYPILNMILIVPAIQILIDFRNGKNSSFPWLLKSLSLISLIIADTWFVIIFLTGVIDVVWYSALFMVNHYLIISGGLLWNNKFQTASSHDHKSKFTLSKLLRSKYMQYCILISIGLSIIVVSLPPLHSISSSDPEVEQIKIGVLLGLSGNSYEKGESQRAAIEFAAEDVNKYLSKTNHDLKFLPVIEDTQRNPKVALEKLKDLETEGVRIVVGPQTSAELKEVKEYADENDILIISHSSTAPSLAMDDNIFRIVQDDDHQAKALAERMCDDGIQVVVPIWRRDVYGENLIDSTRNEFNASCGGKLTDGVGYVPHTDKFSGMLHRINFIMWDQDLRNLSSDLSDYLKDNEKKVAVLVIAFDEVVPILFQAQNHPILKKVQHWYGTDSSAGLEGLIKNPETAQFAHETGFVAPFSGIDEKKGYIAKEIESRIYEKIGRNPDPYYAYAYDAFWVASLTENASQGISDQPEMLINNLHEEAKSYNGITGNTSLDINSGDRKNGSFEFWEIEEGKVNEGYEWYKASSKLDIRSRDFG